MKNHIYCVYEQVCENSGAVYFKIVNEIELNLLRNVAKRVRACAPRTVFVLGPFLVHDEAKDVECQAHSILTKYRVRGEWLGINPLESAEFCAWIDAQILPIRVREKRARSNPSDLRIRPVRRPKISVEQRVVVEHGLAKSPRSQS